MCGLALLQEHGDDLLGGAVAEELAEGLLVIANAVLFNEFEEIGGGVASDRGFNEMGIFGEEIVGMSVDVGEIRTATAGDEDLLAGAVGVVEQGDAAAAAAGFDGAHQACCSGAEDEDVDLLRGQTVPCLLGWCVQDTVGEGCMREPAV